MKTFKGLTNLGVGTIILLTSGILCKALGAFFRLPLTNLLGVEGIGIFQLVMSLYSFALVVTCGGVTNTLSKLIGVARGKNDFSIIRVYFNRAILFSILIAELIGICFFILNFSLSNFQGIPNNISYKLFVFLLPLGAMLSVFRGYFQGFQNMKPTAISQIIEQVARFVFGLLFAFYFSKYGNEYGVFGAFLGIVVSEIVSLFFLIILFFVGNKRTDYTKCQDMSILKYCRYEFDRTNFLLMISATILPLLNAFDSLIIIPRLNYAGLSNSVATSLYGIQSGVVGAILNFPLIISIAVTTTLLPNISYLIYRKSGDRYIVEKGLKILLFLILPTTFGLVAISKPALLLFYKDLSISMLNTAFELMLYGAFSTIFIALMQYFVMLLQANGCYRYILFAMVSGGVVKIFITYFLAAIPEVNIFSIVLGNIFLYSFVSLFLLLKLKSISAFKISFSELFFLLFNTFVMFITTYSFVRCNYFSTIVNLVLAVFIGMFVYFVFMIPFLLKLKLMKVRRV